MKRVISLSVAFILLLCGQAFALDVAAVKARIAELKLDPQDTMVIELKDGPVLIELRPDLAPGHVERMKVLARQGFYDGIVFHRVIDGFMAQTGDPRGNGTGGSDLPDLKAEFNKGRHTRGAVSMARSRDPNSANSQFFIVFDYAPYLDGQYTYFGRVLSGMEYVDMIKRGDQGDNGKVDNPDKMISVRIAADL